MSTYLKKADFSIKRPIDRFVCWTHSFQKENITGLSERIIEKDYLIEEIIQENVESVESWIPSSRVSNGWAMYVEGLRELESLAPSTVQEYSFIVENKEINLPIELKFLEKTIIDSVYILSLEEGWDGDDGAKFQYKTWDKAVTFLIDYSKYIYQQLDKVILPPSILHSNNGSIDLLWQREKFRLLINIPEKEEMAAFYGDNYGDENIKGSINLSVMKPGLALVISDLF